MHSTKDLVSLTIPLHTKSENVVEVIQEHLDKGLTLIGIIHSIILFKKTPKYIDPDLVIHVNKSLLYGALELWKSQYKQFDYDSNVWRTLKGSIAGSDYHYNVKVHSETFKTLLSKLESLALQDTETYKQLVETFNKWSIELEEQHGI